MNGIWSSKAVLLYIDFHTRINKKDARIMELSIRKRKENKARVHMQDQVIQRKFDVSMMTPSASKPHVGTPPLDCKPSSLAFITANLLYASKRKKNYCLMFM